MPKQPRESLALADTAIASTATTKVARNFMMDSSASTAQRVHYRQGRHRCSRDKWLDLHLGNDGPWKECRASYQCRVLEPKPLACGLTAQPSAPRTAQDNTGKILGVASIPTLAAQEPSLALVAFHRSYCFFFKDVEFSEVLSKTRVAASEDHRCRSEDTWTLDPLHRWLAQHNTVCSSDTCSEPSN